MSRKDVGRTCTTGGPDQFSACSGSQCLLGAIGLDRPQIGSPLSYLLTLGPMTMARLPKLMSTDRATTGYNLRPLVRDSFVEISVGENDRRERIVSVTKQGHKTDACALAAWRRAQTAFEDTMGEREAADMRDLMDRIVDVPLPASSPSREPVCRSRIERAQRRSQRSASYAKLVGQCNALHSCWRSLEPRRPSHPIARWQPPGTDAGSSA